MPRKPKTTETDQQPEQSSGNGGKVRIQYYRSFIAAPKTHKQMVRSLGLTKLNQIVERPDNNSTRGAVAKIPHLCGSLNDDLK